MQPITQVPTFSFERLLPSCGGRSGGRKSGEMDLAQPLPFPPPPSSSGKPLPRRLHRGSSLSALEVCRLLLRRARCQPGFQCPLLRPLQVSPRVIFEVVRALLVNNLKRSTRGKRNKHGATTGSEFTKLRSARIFVASCENSAPQNSTTQPPYDGEQKQNMSTFVQGEFSPFSPDFQERQPGRW